MPAVGSIEADVDVPFSDALKDLSFGAMLLVDARKGRFGIAVNGVFTRASPDERRRADRDRCRPPTRAARRSVLTTARSTGRYGKSSSGRPLRLVLEP